MFAKSLPSEASSSEHRITTQDCTIQDPSLSRESRGGHLNVTMTNTAGNVRRRHSVV